MTLLAPTNGPQKKGQRSIHVAPGVPSSANSLGLGRNRRAPAFCVAPWIPLRTKQLEGDSIGLSATRISFAPASRTISISAESTSGLVVAPSAAGRSKATLGLITT